MDIHCSRRRRKLGTSARKFLMTTSSSSCNLTFGGGPLPLISGGIFSCDWRRDVYRLPSISIVMLGDLRYLLRLPVVLVDRPRWHCCCCCCNNSTPSRCATTRITQLLQLLVTPRPFPASLTDRRFPIIDDTSHRRVHATGTWSAPIVVTQCPFPTRVFKSR